MFLILILLNLFAFSLHAQKIKPGVFNDWTYSANAVYGNYELKTFKNRDYYKIQSPQKDLVIVKRVNPSGITISSVALRFKNNQLQTVNEINQFGDTTDRMKFINSTGDEYIVTEFYNGRNDNLPCKYAKYNYTGGFLTSIKYYSFDDQLMENADGVAEARYQRYNDSIRFGEVQHVSYFDRNGLPVISGSKGCHSIHYEYDLHANKVLEYYLGTKQESVTVQKTGKSRTRYYYNDSSELLKMVYYDKLDSIAPNVSGIAISLGEYKNGYMTKLSRFDAVGKAARTVASFDSVSIVKSDYDDRGNLIKESYFDEGDKPITNYSGEHAVFNSYSLQNTLIAVSRTDENGHPSVDVGGICTSKYWYDSIGRLIQEAGYSVEGEPVKTRSDKVFMMKYKYDSIGNQVNVSYWRDSLTPMPRWSGNYQQSTTYDDQGQTIGYGYLDSNGHAQVGENGYSEVKLVLGKDGRTLDRRFFRDGAGVLTLRGVTRNYHILRYHYNGNGQVDEVSFFDADEKPVNAMVSLDQNFQAQRIVFSYKGTRIVNEEFFVTGQATALESINCLTNDCISSNGMAIKRKNPY